MASPFGLPANYTSNPLYLQYMMMLMNSAQQQANARQQQLQSYYQQTQAATQPQMSQQQVQMVQVQPQQQATQTIIQNGKLKEVPIEMTNAVNTETNITTQPAVVQTTSGDGKDDGKISFGSKLKNIGKGALKFVTGMFCDDNGKFSLKRTLTTVAVAAGAVALTVATGGAAAPALVAIGATLSGAQVVKGAVKAANAKTDAEAEKAWQDIGCGATGVVASFAGAKGALKSAGKVDVSAYHGVKGAVKSTGKCFSESWRMGQDGYKALRSDFSGTLSNAKDVALTNLSKKFNNANATGYFKNDKIKEFDKNIAKLEEKISKTTDTADLAKLRSELSIQKANREQLINQFASMDNKTPFEYQAAIDKSKADLVKYKEALAEIKAQPGNSTSVSGKRLIKQHKEVIKQIENEIKTLEEYKKVATASYKKANAESIQTNKEIVNAYKNDIKELKAQLRKETDAVKQKAIKDKIETIENDIKVFEKDHMTKGTTLSENYAFAKAKYITPGVDELKTNRLWASTAAMNNAILPSIKVSENQLSELDAYAQAYGFANAQQMQEYIAAMENSQAALNQADQLIYNNEYNPAMMNSTVSSQYTTNPYTANIYSNYSNLQAPVENNLGFNELYVSPYPDMI